MRSAAFSVLHLSIPKQRGLTEDAQIETHSIVSHPSVRDGEARLLIKENGDYALRSTTQYRSKNCFRAEPSNILEECRDHSMKSERRMFVRNAVWRSA